MPLFGAPNIEKLKGNKDVNGLTKALEYHINEQAWKQEDYEVRLGAANALGEIKDTRAVIPLINTFANNKQVADVRCAAVAALGKIGDTKAFPTLAEALLDEDTQREAIKWLTQIGAPCVRPLEDLYKNLRNLINKYGWNNRGAPGRYRTYSSAQKQIIHVLAMIGEPSIDSLIAMVEYTQGESNQLTMYELIKELGGLCLKVNDMALNTRILKEMLCYSVKDTYNNRFVVHLLELIGVNYDDPVLNKQIMDCLTSECAVSKSPAAVQKLLIKIGPAVVDSLISAIQNGKPASNLADTLAKIGDKRAIEPIIGSFSNPYTPYSVAKSLKQLGWQPDKSIAGAAYWVCEEQWDKCVESGSLAEGPLIQVLGENIYSQTTNFKPIIQALGKIGGERAAIEIFRVFAIKYESYDHGGMRIPITEAFKEIGEPALKLLQAIVQDRAQTTVRIFNLPKRYDSTQTNSVYNAAMTALNWIKAK